MHDERDLGALAFADQERGFGAVVGRHYHLIIQTTNELAHKIYERAGMDDIVMLQRIIHQQAAPPRPLERGAGGEKRAHAQGG